MNILKLFHDFTSSIGLIDGYDHVEIIDSTLSEFSNCESIIRDTRELSKSANLDYSGMYERSRARLFLTYEEIINNKLFLAPNIVCTSQSCSSLSISDSTFKNFNYTKPNMSSINYVRSNSEMRILGIILNLVKFYGNIMIKNNNFDFLQFRFQDWGIVLVNDTDYSSYLWNSVNVVQGKILFYYNGTSTIEFVSNTSSNCNSALGLIYIIKKTDSSELLFHSNIFQRNSALHGANAIKIDILKSKSYDENLKEICHEQEYNSLITHLLKMLNDLIP